MSLTGLGLQGITVSPRFIFGANGDIKNNLHLIDEHKLLYVAGHNVVVYSTEPNESNQYFLQGSDNAEKITGIAVSKSKKYLAILEKANRAQCIIYDINSQKKKKPVPDPDILCTDYESKEFLSACFSPRAENQFIITLTGAPDWLLIQWDLEKQAIVSRINIGITGIPASFAQKGDIEPEYNFQVSFNPHSSDCVVVTGNDTYKFYRIEQGAFEPQHTQVNNKDRDISTKYSCHSWMHDGMLIVCTEIGEIIVCETDGSYLTYVYDSPINYSEFKIESIIPFSRGFIIAGSQKDGGGQIYAYKKSDDPRTPYQLISESIEVKIESKDHFMGNDKNMLITSMCLSHTEAYIYFITKNNQLLRVEIPLYDNHEQKPKFDFVHCSFHTAEITGLDTCIRKQLIVTCSKDRMVKIWNYMQKTNEISYACQEECLAVAFHPSGFHLVVAVQDKILLMNVLSKSLHPFKNIQVKACREIKFSNGGHLFAAAIGTQAVQVYNFYQGGETPAHYTLKPHPSKVRAIDWFENDMGLVSTDQSGNAFQWDLINVKDGSNRLHDKDFTQKNVQLTSVVNVPGRQNEIFCCGNDSRIWNSNQPKDIFECQASISQLCITHNGKALFAGVGDNNKPGSIIIYKITEDQSRNALKIDKINEVQAHSKQIERMRLSYDNTHLFSAGKDGCLIIHDVKDRDPKGKSKDREGLPFSDEILTEKQEIEQYATEKEACETELSGYNNGDSFDKVMKQKKLDDKINRLKEELSSLQLQHRNRFDSLSESKRDAEAMAEEQIRSLAEMNQIELEENRNRYSQKMLEDAARFQELQAKKEEERKNFEEIIADVIETHNLNVNQIMDQHKSLMDQQIAQTEQLKKEIERMTEDDKEILRQINEDAADEEEDIGKKNNQNVRQVNEMSLRSKAELMLTTNKLQDLGTEIDQLKRQIQDKQTLLDLQTDEDSKLKEEIHKKQKEIEERDGLIGDKEKKIYNLKKKTQELEKFKFVLDYKIKELKRDIAPRGMEITRLKRETKDMDKSLRHYNKINANLGFIVDDLRTRQEKMQDLIRNNRTKIRSNDIFINGFKNACYWVVQYIDDFDELKKIVNKNLYPYVKDQEMKNVEIDPDIKKEYENQRRYLENSQTSLKKRLEKEKQIHKEDNMNIMTENISLIAMISELRSTVNKLKTMEKNTRTEAKMRANQSQMMQNSKNSGGSGANDVNNQIDNEQKNQVKQAMEQEVNYNRQYIDELRNRLMIAKDQNQFLQQELQGQIQQQLN